MIIRAFLMKEKINATFIYILYVNYGLEISLAQFNIMTESS